MQDTELGVTPVLYSELEIITFHPTVRISKNHNVLACGQSIINNYLNSF
jgi:hypothetical protein